MRSTGLIKRCPRCGRRGVVTRDPRDESMFCIEWEGPPKGTHGQDRDRDGALDVLDLLDPTMGCGYDPASTA